MHFIDAHPVDLVVLTVTTPDVRPAVDAVAAQLEAAGRRVLVGVAGERRGEVVGWSGRLSGARQALWAGRGA